MEMCTSAFRAFFRHFSCHDHFTTLITVVRRDSVSPPELTGNTPVTDIFQPVQICLSEACRNKFQFSWFQSIDCSLCHFIHAYKPLWFDHRLYGCAATVMCADTVAVRNNLNEKSLCLKVCYHCLTCLVAVHACIFTAKRIDGCIVIHDIDFFKVVALAYLEVIRVMCRCDLNASCSEFLVNIFICDNRDLTVSQRQFQHLADQVFVSFILRVYCNCSISKKCFRTGSCNLYKSSLFSHDRVIDVPEKSVLILMLYFCI